jgi:hypothetical protein
MKYTHNFGLRNISEILRLNTITKYRNIIHSKVDYDSHYIVKAGTAPEIVNLLSEMVDFLDDL